MHAPEMTASDRQYAIRLPPEIPARVDALIPALRANEHYAAFRLDLSSVLRLAIVRGLAVLEREAAEREAANKTSAP